MTDETPADAEEQRPADLGGEPPRHGAPSRLALTLVVVPLSIMVLASYAALAFFSVLVNDHPLLLIILSSQNRYLIATVNQLDPLTYYLVGSLRLLAPDPLFYLLGFWYGDAAVRWLENRTITYGQMMRRLEVLFRKWGHPLVLVFPNNPICLLAGAARMPVPVFATLNVIGTIGRLILIALLGDALETPINAVLGFIGTYRIPILIISFVLVAFSFWTETRKGTSEIQQLRQLEHELDEDDPEKGNGDDRSASASGDHEPDTAEEATEP